ncbi:MAG TPA: pilus assembly protein TadG-related protein [Vicinamibacterales bacterium]|nr:pilus assembly protein TadG-related protein [Vicinamibacterales bacterium]
MRKRLLRLRRDERGMSLVFVSVAFMAALSATTLAIDVGMFMNSRSQAQNAADAGALAGAVALFYNDFDNRTASGPAVLSAINTASNNRVAGGTVSVTAADVTFPLSPSGLNNRVRVKVFRTSDRNNPIPTLMGTFFGLRNVDINAVATAEVSPANAETCVMPFTIPDRWIENQTGPWDPNDTYDPGDVYVPLRPYPDPNTNYTGYNAERDKGLEVTLKASNETKVTASWYNPWDMPGSNSGADDYRANIGGCNSSLLHSGDQMPPEPGNMVGPTAQGMRDRIDLDRNAHWDTGCNCVVGSDPQYRVSPRIVIIPTYDPAIMAAGPQHGANIDLKIVSFIGFFLEDMQGNDVVGRVTPVSGVMDGNAGPGPNGIFPALIRLVQ